MSKFCPVCSRPVTPSSLGGMFHCPEGHTTPESSLLSGSTLEEALDALERVQRWLDRCDITNSDIFGPVYDVLRRAGRIPKPE